MVGSTFAAHSQRCHVIGAGRRWDLRLCCQLPMVTVFHSAMACRRWFRIPRAERCERDGTKRLRTAEKMETKRCRLPGDRKPLPFSQRHMGTLRAVVEALVRTVLDLRHHLISVTVSSPYPIRLKRSKTSEQKPRRQLACYRGSLALSRSHSPREMPPAPHSRSLLQSP